VEEGVCGWRAHRPAGSSKATDVIIGGVRLSIATWHIELGGAIGWRSGRHFGRNEGEVSRWWRSYAGAIISLLLNSISLMGASQRSCIGSIIALVDVVCLFVRRDPQSTNVVEWVRRISKLRGTYRQTIVVCEGEINVGGWDKKEENAIQ
jgi:hypothetical protein